VVTKKTSASRIALWAAVAVLVLSVVPAALAGKGGGGNNASSPTGSLSVAPFNSGAAPLNSTDSQFHWGGQAMYSITTTSTYGYVSLNCYQSGTLVFANNTGVHAGWPTQPVYLESAAWTGGAAACNAVLYASNSDGSNPQTLATKTFDVAA
jgi:hypothetical protein